MIWGMTTSETLTAVQTVAVVLTGLVVVWYTWETQQMRKTAHRQADAAILKQAYDYVIQTHGSRRVVYRNADRIRAVTTIAALETLRQAEPELDRAIHDVANCFHYIGFLMDQKLFSDQQALIDEAGHTILRMYNLLWTYILLERQDSGAASYKQYFESLARRVPGYRPITLPGAPAAPEPPAAGGEAPELNV